jgi:two-component system cell cycle sensor histidine kinase/response regulator CckA
VEDSQPLRELTRELLEESGYKVLEATGGAEAIRVADQYERPIHLLLTDVVMAGMDGRTLAERMVLSRPGIKVLYMSGYTDDTIVHHGVLDPGVALLQKPFTRAVLANKVREILDIADKHEINSSRTQLEEMR